jgi:hypothetical protein
LKDELTNTKVRPIPSQQFEILSKCFDQIVARSLSQHSAIIVADWRQLMASAATDTRKAVRSESTYPQVDSGLSVRLKPCIYQADEVFLPNIVESEWEEVGDGGDESKEHVEVEDDSSIDVKNPFVPLKCTWLYL